MLMLQTALGLSDVRIMGVVLAYRNAPQRALFCSVIQMTSE